MRQYIMCVLVGLLMLITIGGGIGYAQQPSERKEQPTHEEIMQQMQLMMQQMIPMAQKMIEVTMQTMFATLAKPQTAEYLATYAKNYYDALIGKGFSKKQALAIVTALGVPSVPSASK